MEMLQHILVILLKYFQSISKNVWTEFAHVIEDLDNWPNKGSTILKEILIHVRQKFRYKI